MYGESGLLHAAKLILGLLLLLVCVVAPVYAAPLDQQGADAPAGIYNWYTLAPGQPAEWVFDYLGNNDPALIAIGVDPANTIAVNVYDDAQWQALSAGNTSIVPVGKGTSGTIDKWDSNSDLIDNGSLFWEARAKPGVKFHIQVINSSQGPARYWIAQAGAGAGSLTAVSAGAAATRARPHGGPTFHCRGPACPHRNLGARHRRHIGAATVHPARFRRPGASLAARRRPGSRCRRLAGPPVAFAVSDPPFGGAFWTVTGVSLTL